MFFASIEKSGFSPANGSGRMPSPGLKPAGGVVRPPVYSGIVPALLPGFSAPIGVRVVPSFLASSAVTPACARPLKASASAAAVRLFVKCIASSLEGGLEGQAHEAPVGEQGREAVL